MHVPEHRNNPLWPGGARIAIYFSCFLLSSAAGAEAQLPRASAANQCAVCHLDLVWRTPAVTHVDQWVTSRHAINGVGCERCHGGDSSTSNQTKAHAGVTNSGDLSSAVHATALPATCGRCHRAEADAFAQSAHRKLLLQGDNRAPTCTSCHSSMAADRPSVRNVQTLCERCHAEERDPDRARTARGQLAEIAKQRGLLGRSWWQISGVSDSARRNSLMADWIAVNASLRSAVASIHSFDMAAVDMHLSHSRNLIVRLRSEIGR